jgi:hypothetical protein
MIFLVSQKTQQKWHSTTSTKLRFNYFRKKKTQEKLSIFDTGHQSDVVISVSLSVG